MRLPYPLGTPATMSGQASRWDSSSLPPADPTEGSLSTREI